MNFNTKYKAQNLRNYFMVFIFVTIILLVILFFTEIIPVPNLEYALIGLAVFVYGWFAVKRFYYIEYSDEKEKLILRFFKLIPTALDHQSIEIPQRFLIKYELKSSMMGMRKEIILFVKTKDGIMKYPPVSISILSDEQINSIQTSLKRILQTKP